MAKGDPTSSQVPGAELGGNAGQKFFNTLGGGIGTNQPGQMGGSIGGGYTGGIAPSAGFQQMMPGNMLQRFFSTLGMGGSPPPPQMPYTQNPMQQSPIQPTNPQNIASTFFKNLGAY